jgi:AAHS family benzoate transporter-like MFS transporter
MLLGAMIGALVLGSVADRVGRKNALMWYIALFSIGMFATGLTHSPATFGFWRFITGLGVGGSLPNVTALATEFLPGKKRGTLVAMIYAGISVGGVAAALFCIWLFPLYGWRSVFFLGGLPILALPLYTKFLPESPVRLVRRNRLEQLRTYLRRARPDEVVPDDAVLELDKSTGKAPLAAIFQERRAFSTVVFWIVWFTNVYVIFGFTIWLPKLIMNQGFSLATGLTFLLANSVASIIGSYVAGIIADAIGSRPALVIFYLLSMCSVGLVGFTSQYGWLMLLVCLAGAGFNGAQNCMNGYMPPYYPPSMRSTATGVCYGLSRMGAILGPALIGVLMTMHFSYRATLIALALPSLISTAGIIAIREKYNFTRTLAEEKPAQRAAAQA